jgi:hypothetical protein
MTYSRMAADAAEAHRDLQQPDQAFGWDAQARRPPRYTRSAGLHQLTLMSSHLQAGDRDQALARGRHALTLLAGVRSERAKRYLRGVLDQLGAPPREPAVAEYRRAAGIYLAT